MSRLMPATCPTYLVLGYVMALVIFGYENKLYNTPHLKLCPTSYRLLSPGSAYVCRYRAVLEHPQSIHKTVTLEFVLYGSLMWYFTFKEEQLTRVQISQQARVVWVLKCALAGRVVRMVKISGPCAD